MLLHTEMLLLARGLTERVGISRDLTDEVSGRAWMEIQRQSKFSNYGNIYHNKQSSFRNVHVMHDPTGPESVRLSLTCRGCMYQTRTLLPLFLARSRPSGSILQAGCSCTRATVRSIDRYGVYTAMHDTNDWLLVTAKT